jgi:hypothetical protein
VLYLPDPDPDGQMGLQKKKKVKKCSALKCQMLSFEAVPGASHLAWTFFWEALGIKYCYFFYQKM